MLLSPENKILKHDFHYLLILLTLVGVLYAPIVPDFITLLMDDNNSHGLFVPFISLFLIFKKRNFFVKDKIHCSKMGFLLLLISILLYFIGLVGGIEILPRLSLVITLVSLVHSNYGSNSVRVIWFPLLFLFFMVPVPVSLIAAVSLPLKMVATKMSAVILVTFGIPVFREGNMLYFTNASLEVAEACSGIRSLVSYLMLGCLFAYLMQSTTKNKIFLVFLTIPLAFISNLIRVTGTGILAHFYGNKVAQGFLHEFSGIFTFFLGLFFIMIAQRLLENYNIANTKL